MKKHEMREQLIAVSLAALMVLVPAMGAQEKPAPSAQSKKSESMFAKPTTAFKAVATRGDPSETVAPTDKPSGGPHEGIKVHGHWAIEVKNPDGTTVSHTEFENSLLQQGAAFLVSVLAGQHTANKWAVGFDGPAPRPCLLSGSPSACTIAQQGLSAPGVGSTSSFNLTIQAPTSGPNAGSLVLQGFIAVDFTTQISSVATSLFEQTGNTATAGGPFTGTSPAPINVLAGQIVQVTVVISFS